MVLKIKGSEEPREKIVEFELRYDDDDVEVYANGQLVGFYGITAGEKVKYYPVTNTVVDGVEE